MTVKKKSLILLTCCIALALVRVASAGWTIAPPWTVSPDWTYSTEAESSVTLNDPYDDAVLSYRNVYFNFTPIISTVPMLNASLWHNESGTWQREQWNTTAITDSVENSINDTFAADGAYLWNIQVYDGDSVAWWGASNFTFTIDATIPTPPQYGSTSVSTTLANNPATFACAWADYDSDLAYGWLCHNMTGAWANGTAQALNPTSDTFIELVTLSSQVGLVVSYRFYANDSTGLEGSSGTGSFTITGPTAVPPTGTTTETWYFRSDTHTVNDVAGYVLDTTQTGSAAALGITPTASGTATPVRWGVRLYLVRGDNSSAELTGAVSAVVVRSTTGQGILSGVVGVPYRDLGRAYTSVIQVNVYSQLGSAAWVLRGTFITSRLDYAVMRQANWTVRLWTSYAFSGGFIYSYFRYDTATYLSRIDGVTFSTPSIFDDTLHGWQSGDLIGGVLAPYLYVLGNLFYALPVLMICATTYIRYRSYLAVLVMLILFGGPTGLLLLATPEPFFRIVGVVALIGVAVWLFRVIR